YPRRVERSKHGDTEARREQERAQESSQTLFFLCASVVSSPSFPALAFLSRYKNKNGPFAEAKGRLGEQRRSLESDRHRCRPFKFSGRSRSWGQQRSSSVRSSSAGSSSVGSSGCDGTCCA